MLKEKPHGNGNRSIATAGPRGGQRLAGQRSRKFGRTAPELQARAEKAIEDGSRYLLFDMRETQSMTSVGLRVILAIYKRLLDVSPEESAETANNGPVKSSHLKLLLPPVASSKDMVNSIRKTLRTVGFDVFLEIHDSMTDAVDSF